MTHHRECLGQATLFEGTGHCTCPKGWPRKAKVAKPKRPAPTPNPCYGAALSVTTTPTTHYRVRFPFTPSVAQLSAYATRKKHHIPQTRDFDDETGEACGRDTFNDEAIRTLSRNYAKDPLYPKVEGYRILQKALGTYIAKLRSGDLIGPDHRLRDRYRHTPKTLRLAMEMLQVLPRPERGVEADDPRSVYDAIRKCFIPTPGHEFAAADFSNIEPMLVAYFARDSAFLRACRTSSHSWFAAHVIGRTVDFSLSDADIAAYYDELAHGGPYVIGAGRSARTLPWKSIRDGCKTAGMASLYVGGPLQISRSRPDIFPTSTVAKYYQDAFFALCPKVREWHWAQAEAVERHGYLTGPNGFRLHYEEPFTYAKNAAGVWERQLSPTAKQAIAAVPQHTGALYLVTAFLAFCDEHPELAQWCRLLIHDEIFGEPPVERADEFIAVLSQVMTRPHPLMPLDWCSDAERAVMGTHLSVNVEAKRSTVSWGDMR